MSIAVFFQFFILLLIGYMLLSVLRWSIKNGITPTPTSGKTKRKILQSLPPFDSGLIVDLGSGFGSMAFAFADRFPACKVIGYETSPIPYFIAQCRQKLFNRENLQFRRVDFLSLSLADASLVYCYLYSAKMTALEPKLQAELQPNCVVISNTFALPNCKPVKKILLGDIYRSVVYVYRFDAE